MDFDAAWCPACDRRIEPKRYTIHIPVTTNNNSTPPPPPPPSPKKTKGRTGRLVNGTGRLRYNGKVKPPSPTVFMKQRLIIDQCPIPLYCSDECQIADLIKNHRKAPHDPAREKIVSEPSILYTPSSETGSDLSSISSQSQSSLSPPMSSLDKLVIMYNFPPLPPPMPTLGNETVSAPLLEYNSGIMMAGRLITSLCPPPAKPHTDKYRPTREPHQPIPGWTDGSHAWRSAVYSTGKPKNSIQDPFQQRRAELSSVLPTNNSVAFRHAAAPKPASPYSLSLTPAPIVVSTSSNIMMAKFSENFVRRSNSRMAFHTRSTSPAKATTTPSSVSSHSIPLRSPSHEQHLVHPDAKGKPIVPGVKLKMSRSISSASLSSAWSGSSMSASSRPRVHSPLSLTCDNYEGTEQCDSAMFRPKLLVENTRPWSYDNVKTYDMMPFQPKKVKKTEKIVVDGEEKEVEVEVEVYEERKRLFLFAPTRISQ